MSTPVDVLGTLPWSIDVEGIEDVVEFFQKIGKRGLRYLRGSDSIPSLLFRVVCGPSV
jgi:hypothetical protein